MGWIGGGIAALGSLGGSIFSGLGQSAASKKQYEAEMAALQFQKQVYQQNTARLQPWVNQGNLALNELNARLPQLTTPFSAANLAQTPGYQFTLGQGLQATQNGQAAQGLGNSGSALRGAEQYAQGLASTTYNQQLQNYLAQNSQIYNMLSGVSSQGENAAAQTGNQALQSAQGVSAALTGAGNAQEIGRAHV